MTLLSPSKVEVAVKVDSTKEVLKRQKGGLAAACERYIAARAGMIGKKFPASLGVGSSQALKMLHR